MADEITTLEALEALIGKTPPAINLKVIDHLDATALNWIAQAPLFFAGFGTPAGIAVTLGNDAGADARELRLATDRLDDPALATLGAGFGALFLLPGIGETLRVNGRVAAVSDREIRIAVEECYVHCAKALIRSAFWSAESRSAPLEIEAFIEAGRFMALATIDREGRADLSPKGDPAGTMLRLVGGELWFADRPGNRRIDSFRNLLAQPRLAAALLVPGSTDILHLSGMARLSIDPAMRAAFAVQEKTPHLAIRVADLQLDRRTSPALARAQLWPALRQAAGIDPAKMLTAHVKLNKDKGLGARLAGAVLSVPGLMQKGLDKDYKTNLY